MNYSLRSFRLLNLTFLYSFAGLLLAGLVFLGLCYKTVSGAQTPDGYVFDSVDQCLENYIFNCTEFTNRYFEFSGNFFSASIICFSLSGFCFLMFLACSLLIQTARSILEGLNGKYNNRHLGDR